MIASGPRISFCRSSSERHRLIQLRYAMNQVGKVTGYEAVDQVLHWFLAQVQDLLGGELVGMYLYGSLALGDFDPAHSDIDFVVVTEAELAPASIPTLRDIHARFEQSASPWSRRIEAVYAE